MLGVLVGGESVCVDVWVYGCGWMCVCRSVCMCVFLLLC